MSKYSFESIWINDMQPLKEVDKITSKLELKPQQRLEKIKEFIFNQNGVTNKEIALHFELRVDLVRRDISKLMMQQIISCKLEMITTGNFGFAKRYSKSTTLHSDMSIREKIVKFVIKHGPCTNADITEKFGYNKDTIRNAMQRSKHLIKCDRQPAGRRFNIYSGI